MQRRGVYHEDEVIRMKNIFERVAEKLLTVKSIVTILLATVFSVLALRGVISGQEYLTIFTVVIGFYFGTQAEKRNGGGET